MERRRGRILLLESHSAVRNLVARTLRDLGHEVIIAGSLLEARNLIALQSPNLIVLNPGSCADLDVTSAIAWLRKPAEVGVVILSGGWTAPPELLTLSNFRFLAKPFLGVALDAAVDEVLSQMDRDDPPPMHR